MSHNKIKVGSQDPDSSGNINIALNNLNDVNTSGVVDGYSLSYDGSEFIAKDVTSTATGIDLHAGIFHKGGSFGAGAYYYSIGDYSCIRKSSNATLYSSTGSNNIFNNCTAANSVVNTSVWMESIDIPTAGTYLCIAGGHCATGTSVTWQWENNTGNFGAKTFIKNANNFYGSLVVAVMTASTNDVFRIVVVAKSGSIKIPNKKMQFMTGMTIIKLG